MHPCPNCLNAEPEAINDHTCRCPKCGYYYEPDWLDRPWIRSWLASDKPEPAWTVAKRIALTAYRMIYGETQEAIKSPPNN